MLETPPTSSHLDDPQTLSDIVINTISSVAIPSISPHIDQIREQSTKEKAAVNQPRRVKQQQLMQVKLAIANALGEMRKITRNIRRQSTDTRPFTRLLDAIERADDTIDSYKLSKHPTEKATLPETKLQNKTPSSLLGLMIKLALASIVGISLYYLLDTLITQLAFQFSVPFLLIAVLVISTIILLHKLSESSPADQIENNWYQNSTPGKIASYMEKHPLTGLGYLAILIGSTIFFLCSTLGIQLITTAAHIMSVNFYSALYIAIPITTIVIGKCLETLLTLTTANRPTPAPEPFKPFSINPVARIWQAVNAFLNMFYVIGLQSPISMLIFTCIYFGLTFQIISPFLPDALASIVQFLLTGIANPASGLVFAAVCTGWFVGAFVLQAADIITRGHDSATVKSIDAIQHNPIDSILFLAALIVSAHIAATTSMAHVCGRWLILGLITINFKPMLAIADFMINPRKSTIGSSLTLPFMPITIILYPGEALYYLIKLSTQIFSGMIKHFLLHIPLVLIRALFDIVTGMVSYFSLDLANRISDTNIDIYLWFRNIVIYTRHLGKLIMHGLKTQVKTANTILSLIIGTYAGALGYIGMHYVLFGQLPYLMGLPGIQSIIVTCTHLLSVPTTMTVFALIGSYLAILSAHQLCIPKDMQSADNIWFHTISQGIMIGLITICTILTYSHPPLYALGVSMIIPIVLVLTAMASYATSVACLPAILSASPHAGTSYKTHVGLFSLLSPTTSHDEIKTSSAKNNIK